MLRDPAVHRAENLSRGEQIQGQLALPGMREGAPATRQPEVVRTERQIRGVAVRFAAAGYIALVADLYRGKLTVEQEEAHHLMDSLDFLDAINQDIRGAVQYLRHSAGRCDRILHGRVLTWLAVSQLPEVSTAFALYWLPPLYYIDAASIEVAVQARQAIQDAFLPIDTVDQLDRKLADAGVDYAPYRDLAHHAFANETAVGRIPNPQYDSAWAQTGRDRTLTFFARTCGAKPA